MGSASDIVERVTECSSKVGAQRGLSEASRDLERP